MYDDLYLAHHGIKGQRWGVRRYQNDDGSLTDAGREHYGYGDGRRNSNIEVVSKSTSNQSNNFENTKQTLKDRFHLTSKQKRNIAIGIGIAGACLAAYGYYRYATVNDVSKNPLFDPTTGLLKKSTNNADFGWNILDDVKAVNPNGKNINDDRYFVNCAKCSAAYELRRRGFDVEAGRSNLDIQDADSIRKYFKNAAERFVDSGKVNVDDNSFLRNVNLRGDRFETVTENGKRFLKTNPLKMEPGMTTNYESDSFIKSVKEVMSDSFYLRRQQPDVYKKLQSQQIYNLEKTCSDFGPNARGHITMWFDGLIPSGHSIAFENDSSGRTRFIDSQIAQLSENPDTNERMSSIHAGFQHYLSKANGYEKSLNPFFSPIVTRTDNAEPNFDFLKQNEIVKNAGVEAKSVAALGKQAVGKIMAGTGLLAAGYYGLQSKLDDTKYRKDNYDKQRTSYINS